MSAAPIHLDSIPLPLLKRAGQALFRTLQDSSRTDEIVVAEEILAQADARDRQARDVSLHARAGSAAAQEA